MAQISNMPKEVQEGTSASFIKMYELYGLKIRNAIAWQYGTETDLVKLAESFEEAEFIYRNAFNIQSSYQLFVQMQRRMDTTQTAAPRSVNNNEAAPATGSSPAISVADTSQTRLQKCVDLFAQADQQQSGVRDLYACYQLHKTIAARKKNNDNRPIKAFTANLIELVQGSGPVVHFRQGHKTKITYWSSRHKTGKRIAELVEKISIGLLFLSPSDLLTHEAVTRWTQKMPLMLLQMLRSDRPDSRQICQLAQLCGHHVSAFLSEDQSERLASLGHILVGMVGCNMMSLADVDAYERQRQIREIPQIPTHQIKIDRARLEDIHSWNDNNWPTPSAVRMAILFLSEAADKAGVSWLRRGVSRPIRFDDDVEEIVEEFQDAGYDDYLLPIYQYCDEVGEIEPSWLLGVWDDANMEFRCVYFHQSDRATAALISDLFSDKMCQGDRGPWEEAGLTATQASGEELLTHLRDSAIGMLRMIARLWLGDTPEFMQSSTTSISEFRRDAQRQLFDKIAEGVCMDAGLDSSDKDGTLQSGAGSSSDPDSTLDSES